MRAKKVLSIVALCCFVAVFVPALPVLGVTLPKTLAESRSLGNLSGSSRVVDPSFPIDYVGVSWTSGSEPMVRFLNDGGWSRWAKAHEDEFPSEHGRTFSALMSGHDADAFQVRGSNRGVRAVAINTTDGPRSLLWSMPRAEAAHISQPGVIVRPQWGADESLRFRADGSEIAPPEFYPTQKLIVHHTATTNDDPDPAATVRAIYRYHAIDRGWGDIGYNFLIDAQGRIYKGRYSGPPGTRDQDTLTGENLEGYGVTSRQAGGHAGTMGISVLGTYTTINISAAARASLVDHLAWESERHGLDPLASSTYMDPVNTTYANTVYNISGHRDWAATECPGGVFYADLPAIRNDVAASVAEVPPQVKSYSPSSVNITRGTSSDDPATLAADDSLYYRVASVRRGKKHVVDWDGRVTIEVSAVRKLVLIYDGAYTTQVQHSLYVYNFSTGAWQTLFTWAVGTSDQTFRWSTTNPGPYISSSRELRLRASATAGSLYTSNADLMRFTVEY